MKPSDLSIIRAKMLVERLARLSADSIWARRASGLRASIDKTVCRIETGQPIDLELAGHTHSGQIFPFNFVVKLFYPRFRGLYTSEDRAVYVSSGTGTWGPPMRLGTQSEITLFRLFPLPPDSEKQLLVRQVKQE